MLVRIKQAHSLLDEIIKRGALSVRMSFVDEILNVQLANLGDFLEMVGDEPVFVDVYDSGEIELSFTNENVTILILLNREEFEEYKKSRATNTTQESTSIL